MNQNFLPVVVHLDHRFAPTVVRVYVVEPYWHLHWACRRGPYSVRQFQVRLLISDRLNTSLLNKLYAISGTPFDHSIVVERSACSMP